MTSYNTYQNLPSTPPENPQAGYHQNVVQAKRRGLIAKEKMFKKKYEKYTKILNQPIFVIAEWATLLVDIRCPRGGS